MAPSRDHKRAGQAIGYFGAFVALGLTTASIGPTLPGLAENTHANLRQISFIFMARAIGYLFGSVLIGGMYDRLPGNPVLGGAIIVISAMMGLVPTLGVLWLMLPVMLIIGFGEGALDVGGNTLLLRSKADNVGPYINGLHFFYGVGALLSPLIIARIALRAGSTGPAYYALALLLIPAAGLLLRTPSPPVRVESRARGDAGRSPNHNLLLILIVSFFLLYVGAEVAFAGWIFTYAIAVGATGKMTAAYLTSAFWGALTLGRLAAIPISVRTSPRYILFCDLTGALGSLAVMLAFGERAGVLWFGAIGLGLSMASMYPAMLSMAERRMAITGRVTAWFVVGASVGCIVVPWLIGQFFVSAGPLVMVVIIAICLILAAGVCVLLVAAPSLRPAGNQPAVARASAPGS